MLEPPTLRTRFVRVFRSICGGAVAPMVEGGPRYDGWEAAGASKGFHRHLIPKNPDAAPFGHVCMCGAQSAGR
jgi:hypothetical protein